MKVVAFTAVTPICVQVSLDGVTHVPVQRSTIQLTLSTAQTGLAMHSASVGLDHWSFSVVGVSDMTESDCGGVRVARAAPASVNSTTTIDKSRVMEVSIMAYP